MVVSETRCVIRRFAILRKELACIHGIEMSGICCPKCGQAATYLNNVVICPRCDTSQRGPAIAPPPIPPPPIPPPVPQTTRSESRSASTHSHRRQQTNFYTPTVAILLGVGGVIVLLLLLLVMFNRSDEGGIQFGGATSRLVPNAIGFPEQFEEGEIGYIFQVPLSWEISVHNGDSFRARILDHRLDIDVWIDGYPTADLFDGRSRVPSEIPLRRAGSVEYGGKKLRRFVYVQNAPWRKEANDIREKERKIREAKRKSKPFILSLGGKPLTEVSKGDHGVLEVTRGGKVEAQKWEVAQVLSLEYAFDTVVARSSLSLDTVVLTSEDPAVFYERAKMKVGDVLPMKVSYRYKGTMDVGGRRVFHLIAE